MNEYMDIPGVAKMLGLTPTTVRRWLVARSIPGGIKINQRWRVRVDDVNEWLLSKHQHHDNKETWEWPQSTSGLEAPSGKPALALLESQSGSVLAQLIAAKLRKRLTKLK